MRSPSKPRNIILLVFSYIVLSCCPSSGADGVMPVEDIDLRIPGNRWIRIRRIGDHSQRITVERQHGQKRRLLWTRDFENEYDRLWDWAFFVPVKPGKYFIDINGDGHLEVGVATWDGGNNIANRDALIFSLKENELTYYGRRKFNLEYSESIYPP